MELNQHQKRVAGLVWLIVDFCLVHAGNTGLDKWDRYTLFKYVTHCFLTGRVEVDWECGNIVAVVFAWPEMQKTIESKPMESDYKYEWKPRHGGDALFVAEVCGSKEGIKRIFTKSVRRQPLLPFVPIYTYRRGRLHRLKHLNRFLPPC